MTDQIVFNNRERATSGDVNDLQDIVSRQLAEFLRHNYSARLFPNGGTRTETARAALVFGGFDVSVTGSNLSVSAGAMAILDSALPAAPRTYESDYRYLLNTEPTLVSIAGVVDGWALLQAVPDQAETLESRDIWTPPSGPFTPIPSQPKVRIQRPAFSLLSPGTATNIPGHTGAQHVLWALNFSGGALTQAIDLRPLADQAAPTDVQGVERRALSMTARTNVNFDLAATVRAAGGRNTRLHLQTSSIVSLQVFAESGLTVGDDQTLYLYLCHGTAAGGGTITPRGAYVNSTNSGLFVVSLSAPNSATLLNTAAITPRPPFTSYPVAIGQGICVGCIHTGQGAQTTRNDFQSCSLDGRHVLSATPATPGGGVGATGNWVRAVRSGSDDFNVTTITPVGTRAGTFYAVGSGGGSTIENVILTPSALSQQVAGFSFTGDNGLGIGVVTIPFSAGRNFVRTTNWAANSTIVTAGWQW